MARLILDSGAVIALAAVIAETTRGGARDAPVNRIGQAVHEIPPITEAVARAAGRLLATANIPNATVDALIVAEAVLHGPSVILTGDPGDMSALAANHRYVQVHGI